jgi:hypothetical protein
VPPSLTFRYSPDLENLFLATFSPQIPAEPSQALPEVCIPLSPSFLYWRSRLIRSPPIPLSPSAHRVRWLLGDPTRPTPPPPLFVLRILPARVPDRRVCQSHLRRISTNPPSGSSSAEVGGSGAASAAPIPGPIFASDPFAFELDSSPPP